MYSASAMGAYLPTGDPTLEPRWLLMMAGGLFVGGLWLVYLAGRSTFTADEKSFLAGLGGKVAAVFGVVYLAAGIVGRQRAAGGRQGRARRPRGLSALQIRGLCRLRLARAGGGCRSGWRDCRIRQNHRRLARMGWRAACACCIEIMFTVYRDGVRDLTLLSKGYDVWDRVVVTNWSVVGLFLVLFVAGLGVIGWLISVVARAQKSYGGRGLTSAKRLP